MLQLLAFSKSLRPTALEEEVSPFFVTTAEVVEETNILGYNENNKVGWFYIGSKIL